jgi:hypothetical protein
MDLLWKCKQSKKPKNDFEMPWKKELGLYYKRKYLTIKIPCSI